MHFWHHYSLWPGVLGNLCILSSYIYLHRPSTHALATTHRVIFFVQITIHTFNANKAKDILIILAASAMTFIGSVRDARLCVTTDRVLRDCRWRLQDHAALLASMPATPPSRVLHLLTPTKDQLQMMVHSYYESSLTNTASYSSMQWFRVHLCAHTLTCAHSYTHSHNHVHAHTHTQ